MPKGPGPCGFRAFRDEIAVEIAVELKQKNPDSPLSYFIGAGCFLIALVFAYRSFYCMRIPEDKAVGS